MELSELHCLHILHDLQFVLQEPVKPDLYLISASHVSPVCFLEGDSVSLNDLENPSRPLCLHLSLNNGHLLVQIVESAPHKQTLHGLLYLLSRHVLLQFNFHLDCIEYQFFFVSSLDVASQNSLDTENLLFFFNFLRSIKGLLKYFHCHSAANPHFTASIDRGRIVNPAHHELSGHDGLMEVLSEDVSVVDVLDHCCCLHFEILPLFCLELNKSSHDFLVEFISSSLLNYLIMLLSLLLASFQMQVHQAYFFLSFHKGIGSFDVLAPLIEFKTGLL